LQEAEDQFNEIDNELKTLVTVAAPDAAWQKIWDVATGRFEGSQ